MDHNLIPWIYRMVIFIFLTIEHSISIEITWIIFLNDKNSVISKVKRWQLFYGLLFVRIQQQIGSNQTGVN